MSLKPNIKVEISQNLSELKNENEIKNLPKIESLNNTKQEIEFQILNVRSISSFVPGGKEELARFIGPHDSNVKYREFKNRLF